MALEEKERFESDHVEVQGVILTEEYDEENEIRITTVRIETENGAKVMGKPVGSYITIEAPEMAVPDEGYHEEISQQLRKFIGELLPKRKMGKILVVGLWQPAGDTGCTWSLCGRQPAYHKAYY